MMEIAVVAPCGSSIAHISRISSRNDPNIDEMPSEVREHPGINPSCTDLCVAGPSRSSLLVNNVVGEVDNAETAL
jgi:hypothetical protein